MPQIEVSLEQAGPATSKSVVRGHEVLVDRPAEKGGDDRGMMGGEMLLVSLGGCFLSNIYAAIRSREAQVSNVRARVAATLDGAPPRFTEIEIVVSAEHDDREQFEKLLVIAERGCIAANTMRQAAKFTVRAV